MIRFLYNIFIWIGFIFFVPSLLYKLKNRPGYKATYAERFGKFSKERQIELNSFAGAIWLHSVSVGETVIALAFIKEYHEKYPEQKFVLSTTTTTGQELARSKKDNQTVVIYCPIDFQYAVKRVFNLIKPKSLLILETELWPNMIFEAKKRGIKLGLLNARMSDHSAKGYRKFRLFFGKLLAQFDFISAQSELDKERFAMLSYADNVVNSGNMKFDQKVPANLNCNSDFFPENNIIILAASTHENEELLAINSYLELKEQNLPVSLLLIPRHAERGNLIADILKTKKLSYCQKSQINNSNNIPKCDVLLADTTGEMMKFMSIADIVIMGKSLAGHDEGHNLIEPALLNKAIVCGKELKNFRYLFNILNQANALAIVQEDKDLTNVLSKLINNPELRQTLGDNAYNEVMKNAGATQKTISLVSNL